jgi:hypothetical protein
MVFNGHPVRYFPRVRPHHKFMHCKNLHLNNCRMECVPEDIMLLVNLQVLDLTANLLVTIPDSLGRLTNLVNLQICNNKLSILPKDIGKLSHLQTLVLRNNKLTTLPDEVCDLTNLEYLHLDFNDIERLPINFGKLISLKGLYLNNNKSLTILPLSIGALTSLIRLAADCPKLIHHSNWKCTHDGLKIIAYHRERLCTKVWRMKYFAITFECNYILLNTLYHIWEN